MKQAKYLTCFLLLALCRQAADAQKKDTLHLYKNEKQDTVYIYGNRIKDTLHAKSALVQLKSDSIYKLQGMSIITLRADSVTGKTYRAYENQPTRYRKPDSAFFKSPARYRSADSLRKIQTRLFNMQQVRFKRQQQLLADSFNRFKWKSDSTRIKTKLQRLKSDLQRLKADSVQRRKGMQQRSVSIEVSCPPNGDVVIKNLSQKVIVRTFSEEKVKLVTTVYVQPGVEPIDTDWAKALNIQVEEDKQGVTITRRSTGDAFSGRLTLTVAQGSNMAPGQQLRIEPKVYTAEPKSPLEVFVPVNANLIIDSRYNEVTILNNLSSIHATLTNSNMKMKDAQTAVISSRYGTVHTGTLREADIVLMNCTFSSGDVDNLKINSKYSTVTFDDSRVTDITSVSDQYHLNNAGEITVKKTFGGLNIAYLTHSMIFDGSSADLSIGAINATARTIKIDNKYADIKLPVAKLENYSLSFEGRYSNVFTPFENVRIAGAVSGPGSAAFTKTAGNIQKDHTAFNVSCSSCSVDFR